MFVTKKNKRRHVSTPRAVSDSIKRFEWPQKGLSIYVASTPRRVDPFSATTTKKKKERRKKKRTNTSEPRQSHSRRRLLRVVVVVVVVSGGGGGGGQRLSLMMMFFFCDAMIDDVREAALFRRDQI